MIWQKMTIDEYAAYEKGNGTPLHKVGDVWWRRVRPFFYRTLFPFQTVDIGKNDPGLAFGWQHRVADTKRANSWTNVIVFDEVAHYSLECLKRKKRSFVRKALSRLAVEVIDDRSLFCRQAHGVYIAFYERTKYPWKRERLSKEGFDKWAKHLFNHGKVVIHGVYHGGILVAINISYLVEDILIIAGFFSTNEGLKLGSSDAVWHRIREEASRYEEIKFIYIGPFSGIQSLDESKLIRGGKILSIPSYLHMNCVLLKAIKLTEKKWYDKIAGKTDFPYHYSRITE